MAAATKSHKQDVRESGYKRKWDGGVKKKEGVMEAGGDKYREKRKCYKCNSTQHLAKSCTQK